MKPKEYYLDLRRKYEPTPVKLVIVAESPPKSGKYFYNPEGRSTEPLFAALMKQLNFTPPTKQDGLLEFQRRGWVLVDATYKQVDKSKNVDRKKVIEQDYKQLDADLMSLSPDKSVPLILIKANVCKILGPKLREGRFNVLNSGSIPFPSHGQQPKFHREFGAILKSVRL